MSPGHKNPQMPAKPRMEPLAGRGWEGGRLAWVCSGLDGVGALRPAQLSAHEEAAFPGLGWGEGPALLRTSVPITTHKSFSFIDIPEYARNTEMLPRGPVRPRWPRKCQSDCEFCPFSPLPLPAIDRPLSLAWTTVGDFQPPDSFQTIPYPAIVQPSLFLPSSFLLLSLPPFFPPFLPSHLPLFQKYLLCTYCVLNTLVAIQWQQKQIPGLLFWWGRQPVISLLFLGHSLNSDSLDLLSSDL